MQEEMSSIMACYLRSVNFHSKVKYVTRALFQYKDNLSRYGYSNYKDKTVVVHVLLSITRFDFGLETPYDLRIHGYRWFR